MANLWPLVHLGELLTPSGEQIRIEPTEIYRQVTVRMWGKGVALRGETVGSALNSPNWFIASEGQFILSRIDARHGAFGVVPTFLDGAIVSNDFPLFNVDKSKLDPHFLSWYAKTSEFIRICKAASKGTTNRIRLNLDRLLASKIPLPPVTEQRRIVALIEAFSSHVSETNTLYSAIKQENDHLLLGIYHDLIQDAPYLPMSEVAPIVRRPVDVQLDERYQELGIRSFGNGTFHKPQVMGLDLGAKRIFWIKPNDLLFSNVFAWEGAIAVVTQEDDGRVGSHRFISCVPKIGLAIPSFLCFHFLTQKGLQQIREASPGGAGRNRTLGLEKLERIAVPVPPYEVQLWFDEILSKVRTVKRLQTEMDNELEALLPSVLDRAFRAEL